MLEARRDASLKHYDTKVTGHLRYIILTQVALSIEKHKCHTSFRINKAHRAVPVCPMFSVT